MGLKRQTVELAATLSPKKTIDLAFGGHSASRLRIRRVRDSMLSAKNTRLSARHRGPVLTMPNPSCPGR